ncbi:MAG TPA: hypothetical protein VN578_17000 [Candidatus Binatia bacterium]|nr:hypothetical protein [Candidatus Binatia bacterium]
MTAPGLLAVLLLLAGGCKKSAPTEAATDTTSHIPPQQSAMQADTVARIHSLGKTRLAADTNAAYFMTIWNLPESAKLQEQTLDKLALWLANGFRSAITNQPLEFTNYRALFTNYPSAPLLRPLLDDLIQEECYLEIREATNQPSELALAIRLNEKRAGLWKTSLAAALGTTSNLRPVAAEGDRQAWELRMPNQPTGGTQPEAIERLELVRSGEWTLLGLARDNSRLLPELVARIKRDGTPSGQPATSYWLEAALDLAWLASALSISSNPAENLPRVSVALAGDGEYVRTRGELTFTKPLDLKLEPWKIPTSLIRQQLAGFTALRGIGPWLSRQNLIRDFQIQPVPNQGYVWSLSSSPSQTFALAPMPDASSLMEKIGPRIELELNPWLTNNAVGQVEYSKEHRGVSWGPVPLMIPSLQPISLLEGDYLLGRLAPNLPAPGKPAPPELFSQITSRPNLVYYDWEITQNRVKDWIFVGQSTRIMFRREQLPLKGDVMNFLVAIGPKLGNTITEITQEGPGSLALIRKSHIGLTGLELHLLGDWLESPDFPAGFYSLEEKSSDPLLLRRVKRPPVLPGKAPFVLQSSNLPAAPK